MVREVVVDGHAVDAAASLPCGASRCESSRAPSPPAHGGTPTERAAAIAASAFMRLCSPCTCHSTTPSTLAVPDTTAKLLVDGRAVGRGQRLPSRLPRRSAPRPTTQPRDRTRSSASSRPFVTMRSDARHGAHQMVELRLDGGEIGEDVGVIEFEVVQDRGARPVVDELRALVEEGGVVLVGLDHEEARIGEPRRNAEVQRHAADQEARIQPARLPAATPAWTLVVVLPCVPATASTHLPAQHVLAEPLRARHVGQPRSRIASINGLPRVTHVADHEQVGRRAVQAARRRSLRSVAMPCASSCVLIGG